MSRARGQCQEDKPSARQTPREQLLPLTPSPDNRNLEVAKPPCPAVVKVNVLGRRGLAPLKTPHQARVLTT